MKKLFSQPGFWLGLAICLYGAVFFFLSLYKYQNFLYNLEDLSIFNNVLWNTAHGNLFWFSPHGGFSYLGDHLELGLLLLLPIYYFFQSPLTLLFTQTLLFTLSAWPVYLIAEQFLGQKKVAFLSPPLEGGAKGGKGRTKVWLPFFLALIFLLNPFLHNINLEEFHVAPLLLFFFLWTFYFYLRKRYRLFILFFILTLLIREDAALTLGMLAMVAAWDIYREGDPARQRGRPYDWQRLWQGRKWWLYPLALAIVWFLAALKIINFFNPDSGYRFLILYQHLNLFNPFSWLARLFNPAAFGMTLGYLLPFLCLPLLRPKYLLLGLPTFLQATLLDAGASPILYFTHHQLFLLAASWLALIPALASICRWTSEHHPKYRHLPWVIVVLLFVSQIYIGFFFGPLKFLSPSRSNILTDLENKENNQQILSLIPPTASLSGPYRLMPRLSSREKAYLNKLAFLGKKHLAVGDFQLPADTEFWLIDSADLLEYYLHFQNRGLYSALYWGGAERMRQTITRQNFQPLAMTDSLLLLKKDAAANGLPYQILDQLPTDLQGQKTTLGEIEFLGWTRDTTSLEHYITASLQHYNTLTFYFQPKKQITDDYFFEITALDAASKIIWQKIYPPAYGLLPTHDWPASPSQGGPASPLGGPASKYIQISQVLPADEQTASYQIKLIKIKGDIELGPLNDTQLIIDRKQKIGELILLR